jgi:hypothetical protein
MDGTKVPPEPEDLDDALRWIIAHEARVTEYWRQRWRMNNQARDERLDMRKRIDKLEQKLVWIAGLAAGVGAVLGSGLTEVLPNMLGG